MEGIFTSYRVKILLFSRIFYYFLTLLCTYESEPYDTSNLLYNKENFGSLSYVILRLLNHLSNWDGVHFLAIAKSGYLYEQQHAFLPLFPLIIRGVAKCIWLFTFWFLSYDAVLHISGFLVTNVLFFSSAFMLLSLTQLIFQPKSFILTEVLVLYCINPSTIFNLSIYTENLYSTLLFGGLYFFFKYQADNLNSSFYISIILFSLNCFTRSNASMLCVFVVCFYFITSPVPRMFNGIYNCMSFILHLNPINHPFNKRNFIIHFIKMILTCILIISPFLLYQIYYQYYYCNIYISNNDKPYCNNIYIPTIYEYIQDKYWDCGFMKYYTISHIPGVLLALPIIIISLMTLNSIDVHIIRWTFRIPSISEYVIPFKIHLIGLLLLGLTIAHVQIMTRLITSSTPLIYWYIAFLPHSMKKLVIIIYFFVYSVVGCILFTSFYPWT